MYCQSASPRLQFQLAAKMYDVCRAWCFPSIADLFTACSPSRLHSQFQPDRCTRLGSGLECREHDWRLVVHLRAGPRRMLVYFGGFGLAVVAFLLIVTYAAKEWLPPVVMFGAIGALFLPMSVNKLCSAICVSTWYTVLQVCAEQRL